MLQPSLPKMINMHYKLDNDNQTREILSKPDGKLERKCSPSDPGFKIVIIGICKKIRFQIQADIACP